MIEHPFPAYGNGALSTLHAGGLALVPTANLWQVVAHGGHPKAIDRLLRLCPPGPFNLPELIFPDATALRKACPRIAPTLDTLLIYHQRPLTVRVPAGPHIPHHLADATGLVATRLAKDSGIYRLCEDLSHPLVACTAVSASATELPTNFGKISSHILRHVDHVERRRWNDHYSEGRALIVSIAPDGRLTFR